MLGLVRNVLDILTPRQRRRLAALQVMVVARSVFEILGVAAVGPFMLLVSNMDRVHGDGRLAQLYRWSGIGSPADFLVWVGAGTLAFLVLGAIASVLTTYSLLVYSNNLGSELATRLYRYYMHRPWLYHTQHNSATLSSRIAVETSQLTKGILSPLMLLNANAVLVVLMALALCLVDPIITIAGVSMFGIAYLATYRMVRRRISRNGKEISLQNKRHFKLMSEGFGGIRDVILRGAQQSFVDRFEKAARRIAGSQSRNLALAQIPRYIIELAAIGSMVLFVVYVMASYRADTSLILPMMSIYGLAAFKLLPAFEKIYSSAAAIKGAQAAFESLREDLVASKAEAVAEAEAHPPAPAGLSVRSGISFENVSFSYPAKRMPALDHVTFAIPAGALVGVAGASGAGKSTLIDTLLGLLTPQSGHVLIDGRPLAPRELDAWRRSVAYVPQSIYLMDVSIAANIAFGVPEEQIEHERVVRAARIAQLHDFVESLPHGYSTVVGERGIQLSGGQRQRIGIARAVYYDASIIVLDEATNSLDAATETEVLASLLHSTPGRTAVTVTHKLSSIRRCDVILFMQRGQVVAQGTYDDLVRSNDEFRRLAWLS